MKRFIVPETKRNNIDLNDFKQSSTKLIMYDNLKLNFVRTHLITQKFLMKNIYHILKDIFSSLDCFFDKHNSKSISFIFH